MNTMKLKFIFFILLFFTINNYCFSQISKDRAIEVSYKTMNSYGKWSAFSEWQDCNIVIVTDLDKNLFTIYSKEIQEFDIIKFFPTITDENGQKIYEMLCIDKDGKRCHIRYRFLNKGQYARSQLYIDYNNIIFVYNLE